VPAGLYGRTHAAVPHHWRVERYPKSVHRYLACARLGALDSALTTAYHFKPAVRMFTAVCQMLQVGYAVWNSTVENNVVSAQCLDGTHVFGNLQRRCLPTGQWTSSTGVCNRTQLGERSVPRYFYSHLPL